MEWLVLVVVVPIIAASVVLLIGFAGCSFEPGVAPRMPPAIVAAIPLDAHRVELTWNDNNGPHATFEIERTVAGQTAVSITPAVPAPPPNEPFRFIDTALPGGAGVTYRIKAHIAADGDQTPWSEPAAVATWSRAFTSRLAQDGSNATIDGHCIVQRLSPGSLNRPGNLIAITVRGATDADLSVSRVTISRPAPAGDDFDSAATPVDFVPGVVVVTAGVPLPLPAVAITVESDEALLIAFDVDRPGGNGRVLSGVVHTAYMKTPPDGGKVTEAGTQNRAGFTQRDNELWFVDAVDVATKWPPIP